MADLGKTAQKAVTNPLGAATDLLGGVLGLNKGANKLTYQRRQDAQIRNVKLAQQGDSVALAMLGAIGGVRPLPGIVSGSPYTWRGATLPMGWSSTSAGWGKAYKNIIDRAATWFNSLKGSVKPWDGSAGSAPSAGPSSPPGTSPPVTTSPPTGGAPSASPKPKPPCKYGPRDAEGRCPKKPSASEPAGFTGPAGPKPCAAGKERNPATGRCVSPCKYGPRLADGSCPKKGAFQGKTTKAQQAALRKAAAAAEKIVKAGIVGAGAAVKAGLSAAGVSVGTAATVTASVAAAAAVGWLLGRAIARGESGQTQQEFQVALALDRIHARTAMAKRLGVYDESKPGLGLTLAQQQPITDWYNKALKYSRKEIDGEQLSPDAVAYDLYRSKLNAGA